MKRYYVIIALFFMQWVKAQQEIYISGQVLDSISGQGLESCAVGFYNVKQELVTGSATDRQGYFETGLKPGKYQMVLDYIGYQKKTIPVIIKQNNQFLGIFKLSPDKNLLKSVELKAKNKAFKVDKDVFIVSRKMKVAAANTYDILDKIQGLTYDRYNDLIKVDGQTNIKILVDGLEKDAGYIKNLNPDRIKKVEIFRNPAGRYALDGYTAVINVILKKNYTGLELNLSSQTLWDTDIAVKSYLLPVRNFNTGLTYTYNKLNIYSQYSSYANDFILPNTIVYKYSNGRVIDKSDGGINNLQKNVLGDRLILGLDYYINPHHTLSFETRYNNVFNSKDHTGIQYDVLETQPSASSNHYQLLNLIDSRSKSNSQSVFYIGKFNEQSVLRMDVNLSFYKDQSDNRFFTDQVLDRCDRSLSSQNSFKYNAEYTHHLNERSSLQGGYGFYRQKSVNDLTTVAGNQTGNQNFVMTDTRHKLFAYYGYKFNKDWSVKTGIAGEISRPEIFGTKTTYLIYQPYLDIKHQLSKHIGIKLKYRTQSRYPELSQANPNPVYLNPQTVRKGNPSLKPAVTHQLGLRFDFFGGSMFAEPYYHFSNNYIGEIARLRNDGIIEQTYENIGQYRHYGIKGNIAVPFSKKIFWQTNFDVYHSRISYRANTNTFNDYSLESNLIYVNRSKGINSGLIYQRGMTKRITPQGYHKWDNDFLGFLFQKSFFKQKLNVMLLYMLPVDFGVDYVQEEYTKTLQYESIAKYDIHLLKNMVVFRLNYRFSKGKATRKIKKNIEDNSPKNEKKGIF